MDRTTVLDDEWVVQIKLMSEVDHLLRGFAGAGNHWYPDLL
jgi:hypothetical protein